MVVHLSALPSRNPVPALRAEHRVDPYWDGMWETSSSAAWWQRDSIERMVAAGLLPSRSLWSRPLPREEARWSAFQEVRLPENRVAELAAINLWRTLTFEQLAAITGVETVTSERAGDVHLLWSSGLVDVGRMALPGRSRLPLLARPSSQGDWDQLRDLVSFDDWIGISAGTDWRWGSQSMSERHNALAAELCLRAAEYSPVPLVLGEHLCALKTVRPPGVQLSAQQANLAADGMLVRTDGLRIMVELTVTTARIQQKAAKWANMLAEDRHRSLAVVFVLAPHPDKPSGGERSAVQKAVFAAGHASMAHVLADVPRRLMVVDWQDWFPARHQAGDRFDNLMVERAVGGDGDRWQPVSLLDPFDLPGPDGLPGATAILDNAHMLLGVPHWMRQGGDSPLRVWAELNNVEPLPRMEGLPLPPQSRLAEPASSLPRRAIA